MYVKYVASNVKGGVSCTLGPKTLIVGPNGSGKSSVVNALELALGGFASDIAGREEMAKESDLIALAPGREGELFARVLFDDNSEAKWSAGGKAGKKAIHRYLEEKLDPNTVFPLRPVRDAVRGNPATARKFFLGFAVPNLTKEDILARLEPDLHKHFQTATLSAEIKLPWVDKLLMAVEYAGKQARGARSKGKGQVEVAQVVADGLAPLPTEEIQNALKKELKEARAALDKLKLAAGAAQHQAKMQQDAAPLHEELRQAQVNVASLQAALQQADQQIQQIPRPALLDDHTHRVIAIVEHLALIEQQTGQPTACPVCKSQPAHGTFNTRAQAALAFKATEEAKAGPYNAAMQARASVVNSLTAWQQRVMQLHAQIDAVSNAVAAGQAPMPTDTDFQTAQARVDKAEVEVTRVDTLKAQWESAKTAKTFAKESAQESTHWKELYDGCMKVVAELMDAGVSRYTAQVQSYLPPQDKFDMLLRDGQKQVFQFGLKREGILHTAISGAEWAKVIGAMAGACAPIDGKFAVIVPEERAFDPKTLELTLHAFHDLPAQVIITTPIAPAYLPPGWLMVDTNTGAHRNAQAT